MSKKGLERMLADMLYVDKRNWLADAGFVESVNDCWVLFGRGGVVLMTVKVTK